MNAHTAFADYRKSSGKTLDEVAEVFGVNRKTVLRWERGSPPIPTGRVLEIERLTGIPREKLRPDLARIFVNIDRPTPSREDVA